MAKDSGLLVVFGYSDDTVELRGIINNEMSVGDCDSVYISADNELLEPLDEEEEETLEKYEVLDIVKNRLNEAQKIVCQWCEGDGYSWTYETTLEHSSFDIVEEGGSTDDEEKFCRGIIVDLSRVVKL